MPEKSWTDPEIVYGSDLNTYLSKQTVNVCTFATPPLSPPEGRLIYETDTDKFRVWDGSNWIEILRVGTWTTYTPTVTQVSALSTSGSQFAYCRIGGKTIVATGVITITSAGTAGNKITIGVPLQMASRYALPNHILGSFNYFDAGTNNYPGAVQYDSSTTVALMSAAQNVVGNLPSIAAANGDTIGYAITYEIA